MDLKQIKLIIDLMKRSELTEFSIEEEGLKLKICRSNTGVYQQLGPRGTAIPFPTDASGQPTQPHNFGTASLPPPPSLQAVAPQAASPRALVPEVNGGEEPGISYVKSPMVGTFYRSPSPESPAFVELGSKINDKSAVCIVEAMKIMNEIQAETQGTIVEMLVQSGQPVEYGQKLFKVRQD